MPIAVKLRCSECFTARETELKAAERDITCPVCGRRIQNLTEAEHDEIETVQKKQRLFSIIALVFFALSIACFVMWIGDTSAWVSGRQIGPDGAAVAASGPIEPQVAMLAGSIVFLLVTIVLGGLGSRSRFVVEF